MHSFLFPGNSTSSSAIPTPTKRPASDTSSNCTEQIILEDTVNNDTTSACSSPQPPAKKRQIDLSGVFTKTSPSEKQELDQAWADLMFATKTPFTFADHHLFKKVCNMMRPGYTPPTSKQVSDKHLDKCFEREQAAMKSKLKNKPTTIQQDGWTNIKQDPIIATSLTTDGKVFFQDASDPGSKKKTAELCSSLLLASIKKAETEYEAEVLNCVTDDENKMKKTREEVQKERPDINVYGCISHNLNLLGQDISVPTIMEHIKEINKAFREVHLLHGLLKEQTGHVKPQLPCPSRWMSWRACISTYLKNHPFYKRIAAKHSDEMDAGLVSKIRNMALLSNAQDLLNQLDPIAEALNKIQSDDCMIADRRCHPSLPFPSEGPCP